MHSCEFMLFLITLFILNIKAKLMSSIVYLQDNLYFINKAQTLKEFQKNKRKNYFFCYMFIYFKY
jgi:hypothetical protein